MSTQHGKRPKALLWCFCGFEARCRNGLVLHQKAMHKRQGGNGIAPFKKARLPGAGGPLGTTADSASPPENPGGSAGSGSGARAPSAAGEDGRRPSLFPRGGAGAPVAPVSVREALSMSDQRGCYDGAIRDELYAVMEMTSDAVDGNDGGGASRSGAGCGVPRQEFDYQLLATRVRNLYEVLNDAACSVPLLQRRKNSRPGQFNTKRLRALQQFVLRVGGAGLSRREQRLLYAFLTVWDDHGGNSPMDSSEDCSLRAVFPSPTAFVNELRDDLDDAALDAGWLKVHIKEGGVEYEAYYRPVLERVLKMLRETKRLAPWSGKDGPAAPTDRRASPMDGDAFRMCEKDVLDEHGVRASVLGLHFCSDSSQLSWSGGASRLHYRGWPCVCPCWAVSTLLLVASLCC